MSFIPDNHKKYDLLPRTRNQDNCEVFSYPSELVDQLETTLSTVLEPYGYSSIKDYLSMLERLKTAHEHDYDTASMINDLILKIKQMNNKQEWSVLKYVGETIDDGFGLTNGRDYYWPCSFENPIYEGVIDDEEYTSYMNYSTNWFDWEILEDPTGMAAKTLRKPKYIHVWGNDFPAIKKGISDFCIEFFEEIGYVKIYSGGGWHDETNLIIVFFSYDEIKLAELEWRHADDYIFDGSYEDLINDILKKYTNVRVSY